MWKPLPEPLQMVQISKQGLLRVKDRRGYRRIQSKANSIRVSVGGTPHYINRRKVYLEVWGIQLNSAIFPLPKRKKKTVPKKKYVPKPNDQLFADGVEKLSAQDALMRGIEDLFFGFNSYTGIQPNTQHEHYLTAEQAEQLELEPLVAGSMLFISSKKQLYLWNGSHYVLLNKDRSSARVYKNYHPQIVQMLKNKQDTEQLEKNFISFLLCKTKS